ncbi:MULTISPECIES: hemolysin family protein [Limibacillus]|jgi:CBS domain containing-hemolysin-like protein|uniref:CBS domain containing-hemolysin-like protein n=1 Tax=Limibacillus halophilus TaxID=1579333 RepID=A0A839SZS4_9PROT|nr:hemolysin family protein [Limibacillus halophilus]MBB3066545.1 CBS domain containing-hemolysin-like protein [Limibacillus halophilus]
MTDGSDPDSFKRFRDCSPRSADCGPSSGQQNGNSNGLTTWQRLRAKIRGFLGLRNGDSTLRESIETILEESELHSSGEDDTPISDHERVMLLNTLKLRHLTAYDVMVPRADIVAVEAGTSLDSLLKLMAEKGHSRLPVYRETLDEVIGFVHIKDVLANQSKRKRLTGIAREVLIIAPSMRVLDLLLDMRLSRVHMAMVVDEYGGIDGLVTIEDLVEEIVGEIEDEHDVASAPRLIRRPDGNLVVDARMDIEEFESQTGPILTEEEREEDIDTLGGLVVSLAGHVPARGELVSHPSGISFEVLEADPRRIKRLRVHNILPKPTTNDGDAR